MKKIFLLTALVGFSLAAFGQQNFTIKTPVKKVANKQLLTTSLVKNTKASIENFILDYSSFDEFSILGYCVNSAFNNTDTSYYNPTTVATVALVNPIVGYTDPADIIGTYVEFPYYYSGLTIDSVIFLGAHENNTGEYNKIVVNVLGANNLNVPNTTVLASVVDSTNTTLSPSGNWSSGQTGASNVFQSTVFVGYTIPNNQRAALSLTYIGSKLDTFCILASCLDTDGDEVADEPATYANSYVKIPFINNGAQLSTTNLVGGTGNPPPPFAGQNIWIFAQVTYNFTSVTENEFIKGVKIGQSFPNPADKSTRFFYELQKPTNVTFQVFDVNGRLVKEYTEGVKEAGKHTHVIDLASFNSGVYFYTIKTDATTITKRFVVTK